MHSDEGVAEHGRRRSLKCPISFHERVLHAPREAYELLREEQGEVAYDPTTQSWYVMSPLLARKVLTDKRFLARGMKHKTHLVPETRRADVHYVESFLSQWLVFSDPPVQQRVRTALAAAMNSAFMAEITCEAVKQAAVSSTGSARVDLITDMALPVARAATRTLLGATLSQLEIIEGVSDAVMAYLAVPGADAGKAECAAEHIRLLEALVDQQLLDGGDRIAAALRTLYQQKVLDLTGVSATYTQLFTGALEPLKTALVSCLAHISDEGWSPADVEKFEPADWADLIETQLRDDPPFHFAPRRTTTTVELGGRSISEGARVVVNLLKANEDCQPARHLSFGHGRHYCLGARLARSVLQSCLPVLARKIASDDVEVLRVRKEKAMGMTVYRVNEI
ncbi:cytochrome P450 [Streptomyces sp. NPDC048516]|uniref:cytochrome P450 n=1 Tax=Streptomyces sp. NPDC048516 TaxID=3365565 RepID=UPI00372329FF